MAFESIQFTSGLWWRAVYLVCLVCLVRLGGIYQYRRVGVGEVRPLGGQWWTRARLTAPGANTLLTLWYGPGYKNHSPDVARASQESPRRGLVVALAGMGQPQPRGAGAGLWKAPARARAWEAHNGFVEQARVSV